MKIEKVKFTNGVVESQVPLVYEINMKIWEVLSVFRLPLKQEYSITSHYVDGRFEKSSVTSVFDHIVTDILFKSINDHTLVNKLELLSKHVFDTISFIYNKLAYENMESVIFSDFDDVLEIVYMDEVQAKLKEFREHPTKEGVQDVYAAVRDVIFNSAKLADNQVAHTYINKSVSARQFDQCVLRGYPSDFDSQIFKKPVTTGYIEGITDIVEYAGESRGAVTSLVFSKTSIQDAETFAKHTQTISEVVKYLSYDDCGTDEGTLIYIEPKSNITPGTFKGVVGQYFKYNKEDEWRLITKDTKEIIGKYIYIRTAISCKHEREDTVCVHCYGVQGYEKLMKFNLGHWACTKINEPATQSLLSTKHYIVSADGTVYVLESDVSKYIKVKDNTLYFKEPIGKKPILRISSEQFYGLKDLKTVDMAKLADPTRISNVSGFVIENNTRKGVETISLKVKSGNKTAVFTNKFLLYVVKHGYSIDDYGNYMIDMSGWNKRDGIMFLPEEVFDYNILNKNIRSILDSSKTPNGETIETAGELLLNLFTLYNSKLYLHISHAALVAYAYTSRNPATYDFRLVRGVNAQIGKTKQIYRNRCLTTALNMGEKDTFLNIMNFYEDKTPHPLDVVHCPKELLS